MAVSHSVKVERCEYHWALFGGSQIILSGQMTLNDGEVNVRGVVELSSESVLAGTNPPLAVFLPTGLGGSPFLRVTTNEPQRAELAPIMFARSGPGQFRLAFETSAKIDMTSVAGSALSGLRLSLTSEFS